MGARDLEHIGWRRERAAPQRWIAPDGELVDVLPADPALVRQGGFAWADGDTHLNLVGFRLAFADASDMPIGPGEAVRVASLRSLAILKMAAYLDRPGDRDSDLADLAHILREFVGIDADERWSEDVLRLGLDFEDVSPFLLGRQLGALVDQPERGLVARFSRSCARASSWRGPRSTRPRSRPRSAAASRRSSASPTER